MRIYKLKQPIQRISGFSLIEMMIAMTIGLMIIGALMGVILSAGSSNKANDRSSELQSNGRYALEVLKRDIQVAGYYDLTGTGGKTEPQTGNLAGDCYQFFSTNLSQRVWGSNDGVNTFAAKCIPAANYAGSDILVLRYLSLDSAVSTVAQLTPGFNTNGGLYMRSVYKYGEMFIAPNLPNTSTINTTPQQDHRVEVHIYYVNPNTVAGDKIPSLHRVRLDETGVMVDEMVVSGIQNLQVQYGIKTSGNTQYLDANKINPALAAATDSTTPAVAGNPWGKVTSVRVWLLARNAAPDKAAYTDTNRYTIGDQVLAAANDGYRRQVFSSTIQLRN